MWNLVRRCGGPYKWLKNDLLLLGCSENPENKLVVEAFSLFLRSLGSRLLPGLGSQPIVKLSRARPEVQELAGLLAHLAGGPVPVVQGGESSQGKSQNGDLWCRDSMESAKGIPPKFNTKGGCRHEGGIQGKGIFVPPPLVQTVEKIKDREGSPGADCGGCKNRGS